MRHFVSPFQGLYVIGRWKPGALPRAILFCAFGASRPALAQGQRRSAGLNFFLFTFIHSLNTTGMGHAPALKAHHRTAQGNALGLGDPKRIQALKGRHKFSLKRLHLRLR
jgi:hypothetical protein